MTEHEIRIEAVRLIPILEKLRDDGLACMATVDQEYCVGPPTGNDYERVTDQFNEAIALLRHIAGDAQT